MPASRSKNACVRRGSCAVCDVLEDIGLDELVSRYAKRDSGWLEAAPSLRLVVSKTV